MKKFMIITHCDLDGIGAAIIGKVVFNKQKVDMKFCGYHNVNEKTLEALEKNIYSHVFITDISVNEETAKIIEDKYKGKVTLLDHHANLDYLDKYDWATVEPGDGTKRGCESGTSLFYKFLLETCKFTTNQAIENFVEKVRCYDTWDWANFDNDEEAKQLNDYFGKLGFYEFIDVYTHKLMANDTELFDETAKAILKCTQKSIDQAVKTKNKSMVIKKIEKYTIGFLFTEIYHSEIGNKLLSLNPQLDAVILIDIARNKISLRSTDNSDFDCSVIGKRWFGGGGRKNTGGANIPPELMEKIQELLFNKFIEDPESSIIQQDDSEVIEEKESTILLDKNQKKETGKKFYKRFKINDKSDIDKDTMICNIRTGTIYRITAVDENEDKYFIKSRVSFTFLHFYEIKEKYCIIKYLDLNQEIKLSKINNITKDLEIKIKNDVYGVERPLLYNILSNKLEIYSGLEVPSPYDMNKSNNSPRYILIDANGKQHVVTDYMLKYVYRKIVDEKYI